MVRYGAIGDEAPAPPLRPRGRKIVILALLAGMTVVVCGVMAVMQHQAVSVVLDDDDMTAAENNLMNAMGHVGADSQLLPPQNQDDTDAPAGSDLDVTEDRLQSAIGHLGSDSDLISTIRTAGAAATTGNANAGRKTYYSSWMMNRAPSLISREVAINKKMNQILAGEQVEEVAHPEDQEEEVEAPQPLQPNLPDEDADIENPDTTIPAETSPAEDEDEDEETTAPPPVPTTAAAAPETTAPPPPPTTAAAASSGGSASSASSASSGGSASGAKVVEKAVVESGSANITQQVELQSGLDTTDVGGFLAGASYDETSRARYIMVTMVGILFLFGTYSATRAAGR